MPAVAQPAGDRRAAGHGLEAADVAAAAHGVDVVGHLDVAEVAGGALGAATQRAVADDPAADARGDLDEHQVVDVAEADEVLAERHDVDVVVDDDDARRALGRTKPGTSKPSQPGMIGGFVGRPVACSTGPGSPMPTPARSPTRRPARRDAARRPWSTTQRSTASGPRATSRSTSSLDEHRRGQVGDGEADVRGADVGGEHDARRRVERELRRRPPARRRRLAGRADERAGQQGVDALGDGGAAEAGRGGELAARARHAVAQVLQQRAGAVHADE